MPTFANAQTFGTDAGPISVAAADVNGDGKTDLVIANHEDADLSVLLNITTPGGTAVGFLAQQTFATSIGPISATMADVNNDGKPGPSC